MSGGDVSADTLANYENELPHVPRLSASTSLVKHLGATSHILVGTPSLDPSLRVGGDFLEIPGLGWQHDTPWTQHESKLKADRRTPHHALSTQPATLCARPDHRGPQRGRDRPYRLRYPCACRRRRETRDQKVVVNGAGWGHGKGMSQYGASGAAKKGLTYDKILGFYYTGTTLGALKNTTMRVWITADSDATSTSAQSRVRSSRTQLATSSPFRRGPSTRGGGSLG